MRVLSVNVSSGDELEIKGRRIRSGIFKAPMGPDGAQITPRGIVGDTIVEAEGAAREAQAVSIYPIEHYERWREEYPGHEFAIGAFGENLTVDGMLESSVGPGDRIRVGERAVLEVSYPRTPCRKLNARHGLSLIKPMLNNLRTGFYLRVLNGGIVRPGDAIELVSRTANAPSIEDTARLLYIDSWDSEGLEQLAGCVALDSHWRDLAELRRRRAKAATGWLATRPLEVESVLSASTMHATLALRCPFGRSLPAFRGGQFLPVRFGDPESGSRYVTRFFALSGAPSGGARYETTARRGDRPAHVSGGVVASYFGLLPEVGTQLRCSAPAGDFTIERGALQHVFLTEGSGVAPCVPMLKELEAIGAPRSLVHTDLSVEAIPLRDMIEAMATTGELEAVFYLRSLSRGEEMPTQPARRGGWFDLREHACAELWTSVATFYVAGSGSFVDATARDLETRGVKRDRVRTLAFGDRRVESAEGHS